MLPVVGSLDVKTAQSVIEAGLVRALLFALGIRPLCPDLAALRAIPRKNLLHQALRYIQDHGVTYAFDDFSQAPDDGLGTIQPTDGTPAGRWLQATGRYATRRTGYARQVMLYEGEYDEEALNKVFGQKPTFMVIWTGRQHTAKSLIPGACYRVEERFKIWAISQNLRDGPYGLWGSPVTTEAAQDPGAHRMAGQVIETLAGYDLGIPGVLWCEPGEVSPVAHDLANRVFVNGVDIRVMSWQHLPDPDLVPLQQLSVTQHLVGGPPPFDPLNYVAFGANVPLGGLTAQVQPGAAYVGGQLYQVPAATFLLPASSDMYRDLTPAGTWQLQTVAAGADPPAQAEGTLRIGCTTTDSTDIVRDTFLCATLVPLTGPDDVPQT